MNIWLLAGEIDRNEIEAIIIIVRLLVQTFHFNFNK